VEPQNRGATVIDITITDRATPAIERMDKAAPIKAREGNQARAERWQKEMREATPKGKGVERGGLRRAWELDPQGDAIRLHNEKPYLRYVIEGRDEVVATTKKALRFVIGNRVFYRKRVGPAAANDFISKALPGLEARDRQDAEKTAQAVAAEMR
jgi:hypothetical protein